jgi:hypothetical protein
MGIAALVGGGVAVIVSLFVNYTVNISVWQLTTRYPVVITILAVAVIGLAVASLAIDRWLLLVVATAASAFILGEVFPLVVSSYHYQLGFWLAVAGSAIMILGGIIATAASVKESQRGRAPATAAFAAASGGAVSVPFGNGTTAPVTADPTASPNSPSNPSNQTAGSPRGTAALQAADAPAAASTAVLPPAGWYPDPAGTGRERYWSGEAWMKDVRG